MAAELVVLLLVARCQQQAQGQVEEQEEHEQGLPPGPWPAMAEAQSMAQPAHHLLMAVVVAVAEGAVAQTAAEQTAQLLPELLHRAPAACHVQAPVMLPLHETCWS